MDDNREKLIAEGEAEQTDADVATAKENSSETAKGIFDWIDSVVLSVFAVAIIFTFVFRIVGIDGSSMQNTLQHGDRVIIVSAGYTPKKGDVVVISRNISNDNSSMTQSNAPIIKRVIATEGDTVDIRFEDGVGYVYVNGEVLNEPYISEYISEDFQTYDPISFPVVVKDDCIFVLGDNRNDSLDSRSAIIGENGMVSTKYVLGHAVLRIYPFKKIGLL